MRLSPAPPRLSRSPALLVLALPLAAALAFSDETLDKVPKSEGYCSRILRAQGTRREGYTEFSLRVEGDPDFYKPGTSYRGKWLGLALGARDAAPGGRRLRGAGGGRAVPGRTVPAQPGKGPSVLAALSSFSRELCAVRKLVRGRRGGCSQARQPPSLVRRSLAWVVAERRVTPACLEGNLVSPWPAPGEQRRPTFPQIRLWSRGDPGFSQSGPRQGDDSCFPRSHF